MMLGLMAVAFLSFKFGTKAIDYFDIENKRLKVDRSFLKHNFTIGFEAEREFRIFDTEEAAYVISDEFAPEGKHSARVEFPSGREYPGFAIDVYGKDCFDWSDMEEFSFLVYNSIARPASIHIKIRSGEEYPKKEYETQIEVPAEVLAKVRVYRRELENILDLNKVSGLSIFMQDPPTSYILYFDDFRVTKK